MEKEDITHKIIGAAYKVFNTLGFGFLESVYKRAMAFELRKQNMVVEEERPLKVYYEKSVVGEFFVDLFVENEIIVELKSVENLSKAQACPVKLRSTVHEVNLFNWGGPIGQLFKRLEKRDRPFDQLWSKRRRC